MKLHSLITPLVAALSFTLFTHAQPTKIACVGDSITFGTGLKSSDKRYPQVLGTLLGPDFIVQGFGNPGKTAGDYPGQQNRWYGKNKEHKQAQEFAADIYICNLGINDTGAWWDPDVFSAGYETLINDWKTANPHAKFFAWGQLGPDFRGPLNKKAYPGNCFSKVRKYNLKDNNSAANRPLAEQRIADLAQKHEIVLIDALTPLADHPEWYQDGLHPTGPGAKRIAEITFAKLVEALKPDMPKPVLDTKKKDAVILKNESDRAILLDGMSLSDGTSKFTFKNVTVIYPKDKITVNLNPRKEDQFDPTKQLNFKTAKDSFYIRLDTPDSKKKKGKKLIQVD